MRGRWHVCYGSGLIIITARCIDVGLEVTCTGNPGHGSRFIEDTAVEKVVYYKYC